jgi:hypothetical protein
MNMVYTGVCGLYYLYEVGLESDDDERHPQVRRQHARRQRRQTT